MAKREPPVEQCPHNEGVACRRSRCKCEKCGWNPEVDARRRGMEKEEKTDDCPSGNDGDGSR